MFHPLLTALHSASHSNYFVQAFCFGYYFCHGLAKNKYMYRQDLPTAVQIG
jgi:hypothetical protein